MKIDNFMECIAIILEFLATFQFHIHLAHQICSICLSLGNMGSKLIRGTWMLKFSNKSPTWTNLIQVVMSE